MSETSTIEQLKTSFDRDGFGFLQDVIPPGLLARANLGMDEVVAGRYETGRAPIGRDYGPSDDPARLVKVDEAHYCDRRVLELVSSPALGEAAAALTGASMVQVWAVQLLFKPPGGVAAQSVGWHQDDTYWKHWWDGEVFTGWVALSDVYADSGPMQFVRGSHRWGFIEGGNFFDFNIEEQKAGYKIPEGEIWEEVPAILPAGGVSFHHRLTIHGSGPNVSDRPRRSIAVHMRTERSKPLEHCPPHMTEGLDDPEKAPVIYGAS